MQTFRLLSESVVFHSNPKRPEEITAVKPETVLWCDTPSIREREEREPVHYRAEERNPICARCGGTAYIWIDSDTRWDVHPAKCC